MVRIGEKTDTVNENDVNIEFLGKTQEAFKHSPYGLTTKSPSEGVLALLFKQENNEDSLIALLTDADNREAIEGDVGVNVGVPTLKARIKFRDDDKIYFKIQDTEGGDFAVRFNELQVGFDELKDDYNDLVEKYNNLVTVFNAHTHSGVQTGGSNTGTPSGAGTQGSVSTASIEDAKILEIEVPEL